MELVRLGKEGDEENGVDVLSFSNREEALHALGTHCRVASVTQFRDGIVVRLGEVQWFEDRYCSNNDDPECLGMKLNIWS